MKIPRRKPLRLLLLALLSSLTLLILAVYFLWILPFWGMPFNAQRHTRTPITPPWALECWLWEDDINTAQAVTELLEGYAAHDIPARTILIDSPWSTRYNDFQLDTNRYPETFFPSLQDQGYRVVLWMTCMVNSTNKDTAITTDPNWFEIARTNGYLAGNGFQFKWWKGYGALLDYSNPQALNWWHSMQQQAFDLGIDGWKLDGTDTFFSSRLLKRFPIPYQQTHQGWMTTRGYMDLYARHEYQHGLTQNPDFITLIRAIDTPIAHPEGFAPLDAAPVTWIGDRTHTWQTEESLGQDPSTQEDLAFKSFRGRGFEAAIRDILLSAQRGYSVVGSDIGGYHGGHPIPPRLYIRWAQFACFSGLFLNGGHGERRLWLRSAEELEIIRKFAWLHTELVPYLYTQIVKAHHGAPPLMRPTPGRYHYLLGNDILIAPIYRDNLSNTIHLPPGQWRYLFNDTELLTGPTQITQTFPLNEYPAFIREGAILPLQVSRPYSGFGTTNSANHLTLAIYPGKTNTFTLHHHHTTNTTTISTTHNPQLEITLSGQPTNSILRIQQTTPPTFITQNSTTLTPNTHWHYDTNSRHLWIYPNPITNTPVTFTVYSPP
jgi:alpha-glucosidase (family GH31 glycosyl hydrolase)